MPLQSGNVASFETSRSRLEKKIEQSSNGFDMQMTKICKQHHLPKDLTTIPFSKRGPADNFENAMKN